MKSFIIALFACIGLSGCYQQTSNFDIHRAVAFCGTVENIAYINVHFDGSEMAKCMNQTASQLNKVRVGK